MGKRCYHRGITVWSLALPGAPWGTEVWGHCQFTSLLRAKRRGPCSDQLQLKCKASFAFPLSPKSRYVTWERDEQLWQGKGGLLFSRSHGRSLEGTEPPGPQVKSRCTWSLRRSSHSPWGPAQPHARWWAPGTSALDDEEPYVLGGRVIPTHTCSWPQPLGRADGEGFESLSQSLICFKFNSLFSFYLGFLKLKILNIF